ncbi:MAG: competence/damage-inducible protein A [Bacteroidales bacterium]|nr:competence/damage-inducible protein A [Bacteroidales bacterium]
MITASILTIGDELLIGQVIDTNSAFIAENLNLQGVSVKRILSVSDSIEEIISGLNICSDSQIIISTGGLGPTRDDITKDAMCKYFNTKLVRNNEVLKNIENLLNNRGIQNLNENNRKQSDVPESATVLENNNGTAPGLLFEKNDSVFVFLPGVPNEMKALVTKKVIPIINVKFRNQAVVHRTIHTFGSFEAILAETLDDWVTNLPENIKPAFLPSAGLIRIRLTGIGSDKAELEHLIDVEVEKLFDIIPDIIFSTKGENLEEVVGKLLLEKKLTLATAESCTGGSIASIITSIPGSSSYYKGSIVAYSNDVKTNLLKVNSNDIENHGAVSEIVVKQMAENVKTLLNTDYGVASSGIAGPDGGTANKPVGTIWIAVAGPKQTVCKQYSFGKQREFNIRRSVLTALNLLREMLVNN